MKYNIIVLADLHWGAIDPNFQYDNLESVFLFLEEFKNTDMIVIAGDYFDSKLPLNSTAAILSVQWLNRLYEEAPKYGVKKIRIIKGTEDHDNNQLEVFRSLEDNKGYFRFFNENTYEETLESLGCIYCPDENINAKEYKEIYTDNILKDINIGFFHGSFDVVLPDIVVQLSEETSARSIIYEYNFWSKFIKGPMISGHWHNGCELKSLIYVGSYDRWTFNEEETKGFGFIQIDTETNEYFYKKIENVNAPLYITYDIKTHMYHSIEDYNFLIKRINEELEKNKNQNIHIRIVINITNQNPDNDVFINSIRKFFINNKLVKVTVKNKLKKEKEEESVKKNKEVKSKFGFILDKSLTEAQKIQEFIMTTKNKDIPIDIIEEFLK